MRTLRLPAPCKVLADRLVQAIARDERGTMAIETALVAPALLLMAIGSFQVSAMVARQNELQGAASEAAIIALANPPETDTDLVPVKAVLMESTGLASDKVTLRIRYRCNNQSERVADKNDCGSSDKVTMYMVLTLSDTYTPIWTKLGVGSPVSLYVKRAVQVG